MKDLDNVRIAGVVADMLESLGYRKEAILEISDLVKRQAELKENYEPVAIAGPEALLPCIN